MLDDGREMITTTTITLNENGEATEEVVTEVVESEEVEMSDTETDEDGHRESEVVKESYIDGTEVSHAIHTFIHCYIIYTMGGQLLLHEGHSLYSISQTNDLNG